MENKNNRVRILLTLALLHESGWTESPHYPNPEKPDEKIFRAWKGFLFEDMLELETSGMIHMFKNAKSLVLTGSGQNLAKKIMEKINEAGI